MMARRRASLRRALVAAVIATAGLSPRAAFAETVLKVESSPAAAGVLSATAFILKKQGVELKVTLESSSSAVALDLGTGSAEVAIMTRPLTMEERATYPDKAFREMPFATQAVAVIVAPDVWESGVHVLSRAHAADIYEARAKTWKKAGGGDRALKFYNYERGLGVWEIFAHWLYGDVRKAPVGKFEVVSDGEAARNTVQFNAGSISLAPLRWADRKSVFPLALTDDAGVSTEATEENIAAGKYPLARPVLIVVGDRPVGAAKQFVDFLLSDDGQALVRASDLLPLAATTPK